MKPTNYNSGPWKYAPRRKNCNGNIRAVIGGVIVAAIMLALTGWMG